MAKTKRGGGEEAGAAKGKRADFSDAVQKAGKAAQQLAQHPVVTEAVAAALMAAAASLSNRKVRNTVKQEAGEAAEETLTASAAAGRAVKKALLDAAKSLLEGMEDRPKETTLSRSDAGEPAEKRKAGGKKAKAKT